MLTALRAAQRLRRRGFSRAQAIPVHFNDYGVFASPLSDFKDHMKRRGMGDRIVELERGASATV